MDTLYDLVNLVESTIHGKNNILIMYSSQLHYHGIKRGDMRVCAKDAGIELIIIDSI